MKHSLGKLEFYAPDFGSDLMSLIIDLDFLRKKSLRGSTHPRIFFQLKNIFQMLESIGSARIEGNRTTIAEYVETKLGAAQIDKESDLEIANSEEAMNFIEENIYDTHINRVFISQLHKIVVKGLNREGSKNPGEYRKTNVAIAGSEHIPPDFSQVGSLMDDFFAMINKKYPSQFDLLKVAIAHHRFVWIHPFDNGNGRTVRLLTYAMLLKYGFNVKDGRILNPTAIFCSVRDDYYGYLAGADSGERKGVLDWCKYVLSGLKIEIEKIDKLLDYSYLKNEILLPSLVQARKKENITELEEKILKVAVLKQVFKSSDIEKFFEGKSHIERSRTLKRLKDKKMIWADKPNSKRYTLRFANSYLLREVINLLQRRGFVDLNR